MRCGPIGHILIALAFALPAISQAGPTIELNADKQFQYAETCRQKGDFDTAIHEYKRFVHFFPDDPRTAEASFNIGMALFESGKFPEALEKFEVLSEGSPDSALTVQSFFMAAECNTRMNSPGRALRNLKNLAAISGDADVLDETRYRIGWIFLDAALWEKALENFDQISEKNREKYRLQRISDELSKTGSIPEKSPGLAGVLSIVPGGGYLYCGRHGDAAVSFIVNGAMIFAAERSFENENYALAAILSLVEIGFYTGNIYGSVSAAHKYNRGKKAEFTDELKKRTRIKLMSGNNADEISLSFRFDF